MKPNFPSFNHNDPHVLIEQLRKLLPDAHFYAVNQVAEVAEREGVTALLVGGIVRDLMLGRQNLDLDFMTLDYSHVLAEHLTAHFKHAPHVDRVRLHKHKAFGTAKIEIFFQSGDYLHIDLATARLETYEHPGALPTVRIDPPAPVEVDLKRRDYTINAMSLSLSGGLVDPYNGLEDLRDGFLRVLHPRSFIDDPTRMPRGLRYAARFGYQFDPATEELFRESVRERHFELLTPVRKRNELVKILREDAPERGLNLLQKYDLLDQFDPALIWDCDTLEEFRRIKEYRFVDLLNRVPAYLSALCWRSLPEQVEHALAALAFFDQEANIPPQVARLRQAVFPMLQPDLKNSLLYALLNSYERGAIEAAAILQPFHAPLLRHYLEVVSRRKPHLSGGYLIHMGLKPGKQFKALLEDLLNAVLDGELKSLEDEAHFLRQKALDSNFT
ncbi:MAG: CCA tRNA nucleotidyltransferase [Chloroflexi bacterium]|uniref:CCA tRNA nucleotidyltransferase n=1 Tax=Candidatus Chlorohelix allophototropha TaxID=3003348 RepID=A0A8T7LZ88_9CHLR|nr:CCA tRNA nucleotidyltransferase [Chloroflexota bacterium]WJW66731.1 hypothetical protein OZ401_002546 [Chloroflexota bacterium L227-S17]